MCSKLAVWSSTTTTKRRQHYMKWFCAKREGKEKQNESKKERKQNRTCSMPFPLSHSMIPYNFIVDVNFGTLSLAPAFSCSPSLSLEDTAYSAYCVLMAGCRRGFSEFKLHIYFAVQPHNGRTKAISRVKLSCLSFQWRWLRRQAAAASATTTQYCLRTFVLSVVVENSVVLSSKWRVYNTSHH